MADRDDAPQPESVECENLSREVDYLRGLVKENAARLFTLDAQTTAIRHELEQKRRGFRLMADLAVTLGQEADFERMFIAVGRRINATLGMQRTAVLFPDGSGFFKPTVLQGYPRSERRAVEARRLDPDPRLLDPLRPVMVTGADPADAFARFRIELALPYFVAAPIMLGGKAAALLVTGRIEEQRPFFPRLGASDLETVQTVGAYLAAMLAGHRLRQAENQALHDPLTGLLNLRGATRKLHGILALARRGGFTFSILFLDLDGFKEVNDTYGHAAGDVALRAVAERLQGTVRESDFVARIGGDEFIIVISHVADPDDAAHVASKIIDTVRFPINISDISCSIGVSIGIALFPQDGLDEDALIHAADEAMYQAKSAGKGTYAFASHATHEQ